MSIYDYKLKTISNKEVSMREYEGQVILVVNTASACSFTSQYDGLQKLYDKYNSMGFTILGFPCNQFAAQEKGSDEEISSFCSINYGVNFPMFAKVEVNGKNTHPLFAELKSSLPGILGKSIKWNFTKFLIDATGKPTNRFAPTTAPLSLAKNIENLLTKNR